MEIVFVSEGAARGRAHEPSGVPGPGEISLLPRAGDSARLEMAAHVLRHGIEAFPRGAGEPTRISVGCPPTLDDMLAATFAERLLAGETLPPGAQAFARYAALAREGLRPSDLPLEVSLEGYFLAVLNIGAGPGDKLTDPAVASRFLDGWRRMAGRILEAAAQGLDPFTTPVFESSAEFTRERRYLAKDREVYDQGDVPRGEKWRVRLPGGPPSAAALLLRRPKSLLFKYWARSDPQAPGGKGYQLLIVQNDAREWIVSTDPIQRLSLASLAERLQAAEARRDATRAEQDPWFDGKQFHHTIVASPRAGARLSDHEVLAVVKSWAGAHRLSRQPRRPVWIAAGTVAGVVLLVVVFGLLRTDLGPVNRRPREARRPEPGPVSWTSPDAPMGLRALCIGVAKYKDSRFRLDYPDRDAMELARSLKQQQALFQNGVETRVLLNEQAGFNDILVAIKALRARCTQYDLTVLTLSGHGLTNDTGGYYFLPYDYDPAKELSTTAVSEGNFRDYLRGFPGKVLLVLDTCHSGKFVSAGVRSVLTKQDFETIVDRFKMTREGLVVFTACMPEGSAVESADWEHGALSLAMIEGLTGRYLIEPRKTSLPKANDVHVITVKALDHYITDRVQELVGPNQCVITDAGGMPTQTIPIALAPSEEAGAAPPN